MGNDINETNSIQIFWEFSNSYKLLHGWISSAVCMFGISSNLLNIIVLTKSNMVKNLNAKLYYTVLEIFCVNLLSFQKKFDSFFKFLQIVKFCKILNR